jgi:hypothetical protein
VAASSSKAPAFCCVFCDARGLFLGSRRYRLHEIRGFLDGGNDGIDEVARPLGEFDTACRQRADLLRGDLAALGEFAHLGRDDREALAVFARARGFDRPRPPRPQPWSPLFR